MQRNVTDDEFTSRVLTGLLFVYCYYSRLVLASGTGHTLGCFKQGYLFSHEINFLEFTSPPLSPCHRGGLGIEPSFVDVNLARFDVSLASTGAVTKRCHY